MLSSHFARRGIQDVLVSDNGPQFASAEFASFAKKWSFQRVPSSLHYAQSNGKAENAMTAVERLFTKCKEDGVPEFLPLLDGRNTPSEGMGTSPAQRLMGRRCKTLLPVAALLLVPRHSTVKDNRALLAAKAKQEHYYNTLSPPPPDLTTGASVRIRMPGEKTWTRGTCEGDAGLKLYDTRVGPEYLSLKS